MASPSSFISCFSCWSTNPPVNSLDAEPRKRHRQLIDPILNREIGKIENNGKYFHGAEAYHCGPDCWPAGTGQSHVRRTGQRGTNDAGALRLGTASALA